MKSVVFAAVLCLALAGYCLSALGQLHPGWEAGVWLAAALWQEQRSLRLPGLGFFSTAQVFWLTLALIPQGGPALAALETIASVTLRTARSGAPNGAHRAQEGLVEALPVLAGLATLVLAAAQPWMTRAGASALAYLLVSALCHEWLAQSLPQALRARHSEVRSHLMSLAQVSCAAGIGLSWVAERQLAPALFLSVLGLQLPRLARAVMQNDEETQRGNLMRQMERQQKEQQVLEVASQTLVKVRTLAQTGQEILQLCRQLCEIQSVVVFLWKEGRLQPLSGHSPHPVETFSEEGLPGEAQFLKLRLGDFGLIYLGRPQPAFTPSEIRYLGQAASQGALALQIASHMESLQAALHEQERWTATLNQLMFFSVSLSDGLELSNLGPKLAQAAAALVPQDALEVHLEVPPDPLTRAVVESRNPAIIDDVTATRWQPFRPHLSSLLYVPILHQDLQSAGMIRLGAVAPRSFTRLHQNALCLLAALAGVAWKNLELRQQQLESQAQVAQSSKLAAVGQLAAGIAHEMNTPLGSVNLNIDMALRAGLPPEAEKRLQRSKEMLSQTRDIIEKLLLFSRHDSEGDQRAPADLNQLVSQTLQLFGHSLGLDGLSLKWTAAPGLPAVAVVKNPIQQVVLNLLLNARDAVRSGPSQSQEIAISTSILDRWVVLSVADRGPGLDPDTAERIFEPFFTTKPVGQGTGLGLSVARQIAETHEGRLSVESSPGQGACFRLWLPADKSQQAGG